LFDSAAVPWLYHFVNSGHCTWLEFAQELVRQLGSPELMARLVPVRLADMRLRAPRPQFCALSNAKLQSVGVAMPAWQDALARYLHT
jgi:dTDP-4-dehydrorhamnose reductase